MSSLRDRLAAAAATQAPGAPTASPTSSPVGAPTTDPAQGAAGPAAGAPDAGEHKSPGFSTPPKPQPAQAPAKSLKKLGSQADRIEELKASVHGQLLKELGPQLYDANMDQHELESRVRAALLDVLAHQDRPLSASDRTRITQEISDDILGYGPIQPYLLDPDVSEVMVNGHTNIWLERKGKLVAADAVFADEAHLRRIIDKIVSRVGRPARWWTPASQTAAVSTRSSRRWRSTAPP